MSNIVQYSRSKLFLRNIEKGKLGERIAELDYMNNGYSIQHTGTGSDFMAIKNMGNSEPTICEFVEVKTGKSRPSKRQRMIMKKIKKSGKIYTVYRISDAFLSTYLNSIVDKQEGGTI